jgi:hypothetical protein
MSTSHEGSRDDDTGSRARRHPLPRKPVLLWCPSVRSSDLPVLDSGGGGLEGVDLLLELELGLADGPHLGLELLALALVRLAVGLLAVEEGLEALEFLAEGGSLSFVRAGGVLGGGDVETTASKR